MESQAVVVDTTTPRGLKGKHATKRSWSDLPEHLIRYIVDHFITAYPVWHVVPGSWREQWTNPQFHLWSTLWLVRAVTTLRVVCKNWEANLRPHWIYNRACVLLDPDYRDLQWIDPRRLAMGPQFNGVGAAAAVGQEMITRLPPLPPSRNAFHLAATVKRCCLPCRLNNFRSSAGVNLGFEVYNNRWLGEIMLCQRHIPQEICGICLKDEFLDSLRPQGNQIVRDTAHKTIIITEDEEALPGIAATCRTCRVTLVNSAFRSRQSMSDQSRRIMHQITESFIESADGTIRELQADVEEKIWLANNTNYTEIWESAVAQERMRLKQELRAEREAELMADGRLGDILNYEDNPAAIVEALAMQTSSDEDDEDDEMLDEDLGELLSSAEETNILDIALQQWVRRRILDGCWISPHDMDRGHPASRLRTEQLQTLVPAWHPINSLLPQEQPSRPSVAQMRCSTPPPRIIGRAQWHFEACLRSILMPALHNLVQRIIYEAEAENKDVCQLAVAYTPTRLLEEFTTIQLWAKGYDWSSCQTSPTITSSTTIDTSSDRDSPPSTIRTTPSPSPPATSNSPKSAEAGVFATQQQRTPQSPSFPVPTRFVDHVPCVPRTGQHVGHVVFRVIGKLWVEASSGLFKCQCRICQRASGVAEARRRAREAEEAAAIVPTQPVRQQKAPSPPPAAQRMRPTPPPPSSSPATFEDNSEGRSSEESRSSSPVPSSLRRSRTITDDEDDEDVGRDPKRMRTTPPSNTRRRSHEEVDSGDEEVKASPKKIRVAASHEE